jgi:eukaryotic-like serine/threonine-protein kinase
MNPPEPLQADLDPALEHLMSELDDALFDGRPTGDFERQIAEQFGTASAEIVSTLKALHSVRFSGTAHADQTQGTAEGTTWVRATSGLAKTVFGRFEILERLGSGGAGTVFRARDSRLARLIALKVARAEALFSSEAKQRFVREAQTLASLRHPNIIPIYEFGESGGLPYIVEELCDGPNLAIWLRDNAATGRPVSLQSAAEWVLLLAEAVAHAHRAGIVHRDLKPSNVLLSRPAEQALGVVPGANTEKLVPRVSDFGIAKLFETEESVTASQAVLGTAAYMAPEQAEGRSREVGPPADVYSLGVILYELLTGQRPIEGRSDVDTLRRVLTDEPVPLRHVRPDVPPDLEAICMKCLEKNFSARYPSAAGLADDLAHFLRGEPVTARRLRPVTRLLRRMRRQSSAAAIALSTVCIIAAIGVASALLWWGLHGTDPSLAVLVNSRTYPEDILHADLLLRRADPEMPVRQEMAQEAERILAKYLPAPGATDLRGFEWHYLWKITHPQTSIATFPVVRSFAAHSGPIYGVSFSPDGRYVAAASQDRTASVWEVSSGRQRFKLLGHTNEINCIAYSPDGKTLATGSEDGSVILWDADTGNVRTVIWQHKAEICSVAFNPANHQLACAARDGMLTVWDCATRAQIVSKPSYRKINDVIFSSDGKLLAAASADDNRLRVFDASGNFPSVAEMEVPDADSISFSRDRQLIAVGYFNGARVYRIRTGELLTQIHLKSPHVRSVLFTPDDSALLAIGESSELVDLTTGQSWDPFGVPSALWFGRISPNGKLVATGDTDGNLTLWDCSARRNFRLARLPVPPSSPNASLAFSPDGHKIAVAADAGPEKDGGNADVSIWDISATQPKRVLQFSPSDVRSECHHVAFTPDGNAIAYGVRPLPAGSVAIRIVDAETGAKRIQFACNATGLDYLLFCSEGKTLISQERYTNPFETRLAFRDAATGQPVTSMPVPTFPSQSGPFALSPDEDLFAATGTNRELNVDLYRMSDHRLVMRRNVAETLRALVFSRDGRSLIGRIGGASVGVLGLDKPGAMRQFTVAGVSSIAGYAMALSPDGRALALSSKEGVVLADLESGQAMCTLAFPSEMAQVRTVAFSADGRTVAASAATPQGHCGVFLWQVDAVDAPSSRARGTQL